MQMDGIDKRILKYLQENGKLNNQELAEMVGLSPSACLRRVRSLEHHGVIKSYRAVLDADKLGFELEAIVHVTLDQNRSHWHEQFVAAIAAYEEIVQASIVTGTSNYILTIHTRSMASFSRFIEDQLIHLPGVLNLCSHIVMRKIKDRSGMLPLGHL